MQLFFLSYYMHKVLITTRSRSTYQLCILPVQTAPKTRKTSEVMQVILNLTHMLSYATWNQHCLAITIYISAGPWENVFYVICEQQRRRSACASAQSDQRLCFRCLDSIISLDSIAEISRLKLASVAAQTGLCLAWSETPEDTFCRVVAHFHSAFSVFREHMKLPCCKWVHEWFGKFLPNQILANSPSNFSWLRGLKWFALYSLDTVKYILYNLE